MSIHLGIVFLVYISFILCFMGGMVLYKNVSSPKNISFFLLALFAILWINIAYFEDEFTDTAIMFALLKADFVVGAFLAAFVLWFCLNMAQIKILKSKLIKVVVFSIPLLLAPAILWSDFIISGYEVVNSVIAPTFGVASYIYDAYVTLAVFFSIGVLIRGYYRSRGAQRHKYGFLLTGLSLTFLTIIVTNVFIAQLVADGDELQIYTRIGIFSMVFFIGFSGYAILRQGLFSMKMLTTEVTLFVLLSASLIQIFTAPTYIVFAINLILFGFLVVFSVFFIRSLNHAAQQRKHLEEMTQKLARANKELQKLDNAKSEFISIASHQLRTPLTATKGYISLVLEGAYGPMTEEVSGALNKVYSANERLIQLVEDLLNISRIESGRMEFKFENVVVSDIVENLHDTFILRARDKGLDFQIDIAPESRGALIYADPSKIQEVISNLIDNAMKYTPKGFVHVRLEVVGSVVHIIVTDSGIGIPASVIPQLFAKFSRGKDTSRLHVEGTGLGLYVGKNIVVAHHGQILVASPGEGKGSTFTLELPLVTDPDDAAKNV